MTVAKIVVVVAAVVDSSVASSVQVHEACELALVTTVDKTVVVLVAVVCLETDFEWVLDSAIDAAKTVAEPVAVVDCSVADCAGALVAEAVEVAVVACAVNAAVVLPVSILTAARFLTRMAFLVLTARFHQPMPIRTTRLVAHVIF